MMMIKKSPLKEKIRRGITWLVQLITLVIELPFFLFFLRLRIKGAENIRSVKGKPLIFATNHVTHIDPLLLPVALFLTRHFPAFMVSLPRSEYRDNWFERVFYGGTIFKLMGAYPTFRGLGNFEKSLRHQIHLIQSGHSMNIFPEGVATKDHEFRDAKPGVAYLAHRTGAEVVPVALHGMEHMTIKSFFMRKHAVTLIFGKPYLMYSTVLSEEEAKQPLSKEQRAGYWREAQVLMSHVRVLKQKESEARQQKENTKEAKKIRTKPEVMASH